MIIEQADRVDMLIFTLPVRDAIFDKHGMWTPTRQAVFIGDLFDDYVHELDLGISLRRFDYPVELPADQWQAKVGIVPRDGWQVWQARYARLVINGAGDSHGG